MKLAMFLVFLAALCFLAAGMIVHSRNPDGSGMTLNDWFGVACIGFLILAGARVLFAVALGGRREGMTDLLRPDLRDEAESVEDAKRRRIDERLPTRWTEGAEEKRHRRLGRGLATDELERVLRRYPGDL